MNSCKCINTNQVPWYPRLPILLNGGMVESVTHDNGTHVNISDITTYSLQRIVDTNVLLYPTRMLIIENFIEPTLYKNLAKTFPKRHELREDEPVGRFQSNNININDYYNTFYNQIINNKIVKAAILDKLGIEFKPRDKTDIQLWEDTENFNISDVHIDNDKFDVTFGLYMPEDDSIKEYGTEFWSPKKYTDDWDTSFRKHDCDFIFKIPFIPNIIYFMPRCNKSWHSSPDITSKLSRKHIYGFYEKE
tara:strand:- start:1015 stop:1758 length:744 start_codon:yes stop_codon:yes gene_type:complete